jgi:hypothetical protein
MAILLAQSAIFGAVLRARRLYPAPEYRQRTGVPKRAPRRRQARRVAAHQRAGSVAALKRGSASGHLHPYAGSSVIGCRAPKPVISANRRKGSTSAAVCMARDKWAARGSSRTHAETGTDMRR